MPPTCGRTVTVEYAITWPTGGGSICTGTLVVNARATSTGVLPPRRGCLAPPEQPPASIAAASAKGWMGKGFFSWLVIFTI